MLQSCLRSAHRRLLSPLLMVGLIAAPAQATWSIAVIDIATGEVVVAGATCIPDFYLPQPIACVAVGKGGGASQSFVLHVAKGLMFDGLQAGRTPDQIMNDIFATGLNMPVRQFGIVGLEGPPATFTGSQNGSAATGLAGQSGSLRYSIQGNVLAQAPLIAAAVETLITAEGDLGQRVMAAMETASAMGGDGRCSCPGGAPPCGQPSNFRRAAATSFMIVSRLGDTDSTTCGVTNNNCSNGDYYGLISEVGNFSTPDPIEVLRRRYEAWRGALRNRPDHFMSEVLQTSQIIKADGQDSTVIDIDLRDVDGQPLVSGGQTLLVSVLSGPAVSLSPVIDAGNGSHHFTLTAGTEVGLAQLRIVVQDGIRDVQLFPDLEVQLAAPSELFIDQHTASATSGALVEFELETPSNPGGVYQLFGSTSGTTPGTPFGGLQLPLNRDRFMNFTITGANGPWLPNSMGTLDANGEATAFLDILPGALNALIGRHFDFVVFQAGGAASASRVTNLVGFDLER